MQLNVFYNEYNIISASPQTLNSKQKHVQYLTCIIIYCIFF